MSKDSTYTITEAQARLPALVKQDSFTIARHGQVVGVFLSKERIEALVESMELMGNPDFVQALKQHQGDKGKTFTVAELDAAMSA